MTPDSHRLAGLAVVATLVIACAGLRLAALPSLHTPEHDDAISYLAATCHQAEYGLTVTRRAPPFARWATAADWQRLWSVEDRFCFQRIGRDLGERDIHPPLYFWLLHLWLIAFGVTVRSGPSLNVLISAGTVVLVYVLGRRFSPNRAAASVGALTWALSPATLSITLIARQYELLALFAVAFILLILTIAEPQRSPAAWEHFSLAVITAGGLLTHYHFLLLVAAGGLVALWRLRRSPRGRRLAVEVAIGAGAVGHLLLHPYVLHSFTRSQGKTPPWDWGKAVWRTRKVIATVADFGGTGLTRAIWALALLAAAALLIGMARRWRRGDGDGAGFASLASLVVVVLLIWSAIVVLYVSMLTPYHAMRPRDLAMVWPLLSIVVIASLWRRGPGRWLACALCLALPVTA